MLTVDVNNVMTQLRLVEIEADYDTSLVVEEYNPDCFVLVYAVDDRESFGKNHHHPLFLRRINKADLRVVSVFGYKP